MRSVFLDAGYIVAIEVGNDQHHNAAVKHWTAVRSVNPPQLVTTSFVFDEVVTFLNDRGQHKKAVQVGKPAFNQSAGALCGSGSFIV